MRLPHIGHSLRKNLASSAIGALLARLNSIDCKSFKHNKCHNGLCAQLLDIPLMCPRILAAMELPSTVLPCIMRSIWQEHLRGNRLSLQTLQTKGAWGLAIGPSLNSIKHRSHCHNGSCTQLLDMQLMCSRAPAALELPATALSGITPTIRQEHLHIFAQQSSCREKFCNESDQLGDSQAIADCCTKHRSSNAFEYSRAHI